MAGGVDWTLLRQARITQEEFASFLHVSRVTVCLWVKGRVAPAPKRQRAVERLLWAIEQAVVDKRFPFPPGEDRVSGLKRVLVYYLRTHSA